MYVQTAMATMSEKTKWSCTTEAPENRHKYPLEGPLKSRRFLSFQNLKLAFYIWEPPRGVELKGVVCGMHGIASHARFEWLKHDPVFEKDAKASSKKSEEYGTRRELTYAGSFVEKLNNAGFALYAMDLQSHGESESCSARRCDIKEFEDFAVDALQFLYIVNDHVNHSKAEESHELLPIFIAGCSMGACATLRAAQLLEEDLQSIREGKSSAELHLPHSHPELLCPNFRGIAVVAPMLSLESMRKKLSMRVLNVVANLFNYIAPNLKVVALPPHPLFPHLDDDLDRDPLTYSDKVSVKISVIMRDILAPTLARCSLIGKETSKCCQNDGKKRPGPAVLIIHSKIDTMCDPKGSEDLYEQLVSIEDKKLYLIDNLWHMLMIEPGNDNVHVEFISWVTEKSSQSLIKYSGDAKPTVSKL